MLVGGSNQIVGCTIRILNPRSTVSTTIIVDGESWHPIHVDHTRIRELTLNTLREISADKEFASKCWPHPFIVEHKIQSLASETGLLKEEYPKRD